MEVLIFRTDIKSKKKVKSVKSIFNNHNDIINWSVDLEDIDNVLRIEANENLLCEDVIKIVKLKGFYIKPLTE